MIRKIILVLFSLILTIFVVEIFLQFIEPKGFLEISKICRVNQIKSGTYFMQFNRQLGWSLIPNIEAVRVSRYGDYTTKVKINSKGLRDYEYPYNKPENVFRILLIGDSFTMASHVDIDKSVAKRLETKLNSSVFGNVKFEVINAGFSAYGSDQEYMFYKLEGYKYSPDLVLLMFYIGNDVRNNSYKLETFYRKGAIYKPFFCIYKSVLKKCAIKMNAAYGKKRFECRRLQWLQINSALFRNLTPFLKKINIDNLTCRKDNNDTALDINRLTVDKNIRLDSNIYLKNAPSAWGEGWEITEKLILKLKQLVQSHDSEFGVVVVPSFIQIDEKEYNNWSSKLDEKTVSSIDLNSPNLILKEFFEKNNIDKIFLQHYFKRLYLTANLKLYFEKDKHWNSEGHKLASKVVFDWILMNYLKEGKMLKF